MVNSESTLIQWLRLFRLSNLPTAVSNILVGYFVVHGSWTPAPNLLLLILSSACLYTAGMALNDVFDAESDREHRPNRPIPAGHIDVRAAAVVGASLLVTGVILAALAGSAESGWEGALRSACVAIVLAVFIVLYDGVFKKFAFGPVLMGACRTLNILLGASTAAMGTGDSVALFGWPILAWWFAISVGIYVTGITYFARTESQATHPLRLAASAFIAVAGLVVLGSLPYGVRGFAEISSRMMTLFPALIFLVSITIVRRFVIAVATADPKDIQLAVITALRSLIILDASICFLIAPGQIWYAVTVLSLLLPAVLLSKWVPPT